jgi:hypothetical protein
VRCGAARNQGKLPDPYPFLKKQPLMLDSNLSWKRLFIHLKTKNLLLVLTCPGFTYFVCYKPKKKIILVLPWNNFRTPEGVGT